MDALPSLCMSCRRNKGDGVCSAFPGGIPVDIILYGADHRLPVKGDHGLQYLPKQDSEQEFNIWQEYHKGMVERGVIEATEESGPVRAERRKADTRRPKA